MIKKRLLITLAVMVVLLSVAAVPALAETKNGPLVFADYQDGTLGTFDLQTARQGPSNVPTPFNGYPSGRYPEVTPDGRTLVYGVNSLGGELYSVPMNDSAAPTMLTTNGPVYPNSYKAFPTVSPDGKTVYFEYVAHDENSRLITADIYSVPIEGGGTTQVTHDNKSHYGLEITPDGEHFVYSNLESGTIQIQPVSGGPETTLYDGCPVDYCDPAVSPDGTKVAFMKRDENGRYAIYTMPFSTSPGGTPTKVSGSDIYHSSPSYGDLRSDLMVAFSPDGEYLTHSIVVDGAGSCPLYYCGSDEIYAETRVIPVGGGNYNSIQWADGYNQDQVAWAPAVSSDTTKPTSKALPLPQANSAGWNNGEVKVTLSATDNEGGSGVEKITYSASGAQTIVQRDELSSSVEVLLNHEGTTTITYFATDKAGNVEDANTLTVKIDKTSPKVDTVSPANAAKGVARGTSVTATFTEKMAPATLTRSTFKLFKVNPDRSTTQITNTLVTLSEDGLTATLNPFGSSTTRLAPNTKYRAVVTTGTKDLAANALDQNATTEGNQPMRWTFITR